VWSSGTVHRLRQHRRAGTRACVLDCGSPLALSLRDRWEPNLFIRHGSSCTAPKPKRKRTGAVPKVAPLFFCSS